MLYGLPVAQNCLLTVLVDQLHERPKKVNSVERLTRHLSKGIPSASLCSYLSMVRTWVPDEPVIHIDDSDVVKPDGYAFESLGIVQDGSRSTNNRNVYEKGYHVSEACVLTMDSHPVSIFSGIHSSTERNITSINRITFAAMERGASQFKKQLLSWTEGMITIICSLSWMN